ncbi:hypothetical protein [Paenibacillus humicola]|uniref:hypothetical protein n=1 Tax=Paenibacillus humicola TaxID=3110540 RepID=UPI00237B2529|nr:hypothetical protein [Paenibacillus humicola]
MRIPILFLIVYGLLTLHFADKAAAQWKAGHDRPARTYALLAAVGTATFAYRTYASFKTRNNYL